MLLGLFDAPAGSSCWDLSPAEVDGCSVFFPSSLGKAQLKVSVPLAPSPLPPAQLEGTAAEGRSSGSTFIPLSSSSSSSSSATGRSSSGVEEQTDDDKGLSCAVVDSSLEDAIDEAAECDAVGGSADEEQIIIETPSLGCGAIVIVCDGDGEDDDEYEADDDVEQQGS